MIAASGLAFRLAALLLVGSCAAVPTRTSDWIVVAASPEVPAGIAVEAELLAIELGLPLTFSQDAGSKTVVVHGFMEDGVLGLCGTGLDCDVWVWPDYPAARVVAGVVLHEVCHSYGLGHDTRRWNLMEAKFDPFARWWLDEDQRGVVLRALGYDGGSR